MAQIQFPTPPAAYSPEAERLRNDAINRVFARARMIRENLEVVHPELLILRDEATGDRYALVVTGAGDIVMRDQATQIDYPLSGGGGGGPPDPHAASHKNGGSDELLLNEFGEPTGSVDFSLQQALSFRVENRTSDPGSPSEGRLWIRTDIS